MSHIPKAIVGSSRGWLPLFSIYQDSVLAGRGAGADDVDKMVFEHEGSTTDVISALWNNPANKDVVDAFMNNKLCVDAAQGKKEAIDAYKKYAVQDYFYLIDWFKFLVLRLSTLPHDDLNLDGLSDELSSVCKSLDTCVKDWYTTCLKPESNDSDGLGLTKEDFQVERTIGQVAYGQYLLNNSRSDNWYSLHIILIGCCWGWSKLALTLYEDPKTDKSTIFYKSWICGSVDTNVDPPQMAGSAKALSLFLDKSQEVWSSQVSYSQAQELFRMVLRLEVGLFNSAYDASVKKPPAHDVPVGLPPPRGGRGPTGGSSREREWRKLLGLDSGSEGNDNDNDNDEDGARERKM